MAIKSRRTKKAATKVSAKSASLRRKAALQQASAATASNATSVSITVFFFDSTSLHPIDVPETTKLTFSYAGKQYPPASLSSKPDQKLYTVQLPPALQRAVIGKQASVDLLLDPFEVKCTRYMSVSISTQLPPQGTESCTLPVPVYQVQEVCTIVVRTYDSSAQNFTEQAEYLLDDVEVTVRALKSPAHTQDATSTALPPPRSKKTVNGCVEIDVPCGHLYQIAVQAAGYTCKTSLQYRYICCERGVQLTAYLRPCETNSARMLILMDECHNPSQNANVDVGGHLLTSDSTGSVSIPSHIVGPVPISWPGKDFQPAHLNLTEGAPTVFVATVTDQHPQLTSGSGLQRFQFVDEKEQPFRGRRVVVEDPSGKRAAMLTDEDGYFEAPDGSRAYAEEDDLGTATEIVLLSSSGD